jgi:biotin/methionine sulfoxide reductase
MAHSNPLDLELTSAHWGAYEVLRKDGQAVGLGPYRGDPSPSPIGLAMWDAYHSPLRIKQPAVRAGWLRAHERGEVPDAASHGPGRGQEPFVEVSWARAIELVAGELRRVIDAHGNHSIFGGSYGWSSAGRFHHAQSQVHRFLNASGGYVRHVDSYSLGAGRALLPHVICSMDHLLGNQHDWGTLAAHTRLFVSFGGAPARNAQVGAGAASEHRLPSGLAALAGAGCRLINFSPVRADLEVPREMVEWIPIRPGTDTAVMLALSCETIRAGRQDVAFLARYCVGFERWADYLLGRIDGVVRDAEWAAPIAQVSAQRLRDLAAQMSETRCLINVAWSLQRADHGEQPFWSAVGLAAVLGQIGLPGGGFAFAYGPSNAVGSPHRLLPGPVLPQGDNAVSDFIPVARIADMLLSPGEPFTYCGQNRRYPDIRLVYWAGGNPFHHHQDLHRLARAWHKPQSIVVHEQFWNAHAKMADIVLPASSMLERDDIGHATRDPLMIAMRKACEPPGQARDDYAIFSDIARVLGCEATFTEGRDARQWLQALYGGARERLAKLDVELPEFDAFWSAGGVRLPDNDRPVVTLEAFRADPVAHPLGTPSGRIELFSERIDAWGYADCPGHPAWFEPAEWLGSPQVLRFPLHMLSDQPHTKLHSQLDHSAYSLGNKVAGREPVMISPADAAARGIVDGDLVRIFNDRGACLAGARISDAMRDGVVKLSTGAWWSPQVPGDSGSLDLHGNPNTLTRDAGASSLSQGCAAQTCLVQIERYLGEAPAHCAYELPVFVGADALGDCAPAGE